MQQRDLSWNCFVIAHGQTGPFYSPSAVECSATPSAGPSTAQSPILVSSAQSGSSLRSMRSSKAAIRDSSALSPFSRSDGCIVDVVGSGVAQARTRRDCTASVNYITYIRINLRAILQCSPGWLERYGGTSSAIQQAASRKLYLPAEARTLRLPQ